MNKYSFAFAGGQILGARKSQQDMYGFHLSVDKNTITCLLADGMGGHASGEVAAELAVQVFLKPIREPDGPDSQEFMRLLDTANRALQHDVSQFPEHEGMGCTLVALEVNRNVVSWISVGDSPLYLASDTGLVRLNADHSMGWQLDAAAERGEITFEEAKNSSSRNVLTSALTGDPIRRVDQVIAGRHLVHGEWLILASDGLDTLSSAEISSIVKTEGERGAEVLLASLLAAIEKQARPTQDNVTICLISLKEIQFEDDKVVTRPIALTH